MDVLWDGFALVRSAQLDQSCWDWMFGAAWGPRGAAARIRHLLDHGLPEDWREQMSGERPLCYAERVEG